MAESAYSWIEQLRLGEPELAEVDSIGVISDTHGLVRPEALAILKGSKMIIHAGDIGGPKVLEAFEAVAPVVAVRGNNDREEWARKLPKVKVIEFDDVRIAVVHILRDLNLNASDLDCVISGHSHRASAKRRNGVLYLNPGAAGPRRFRQPVTIALLRVQEKALDAEVITLKM